MISRITQQGVIAVVTVETTEQALQVAKSLIAGGLNTMEITLRTPGALDAIRKLAQAFPEILLGAGTILTTDQLSEAKEAGAQFGLAPGLNETVVKFASQIGLPFVPGVMTPSDIEKSLALGCQLQKFFPAETSGGTAMLDSISKPYAHTKVRFIPLGGLSPSNMTSYLQLPAVAAIGGSWIASKKLIATGNWSQITQNAAKAIDLARLASTNGPQAH